jgi:hypothetical protein
MKLTKQERSTVLAALRYFSANLDDAIELDLNDLHGLPEPSEDDVRELYGKIGQPDFHVGDKVLCTPLNLPNGDRAPNRNFEEPFEGRLIQITHDFKPKGAEASCIVLDDRGRSFGMDLDQLSHPEDS